MKIVVLSFAVILFQYGSYGQSESQGVILNKFISAHNIGTKSAFMGFMKATYNPKLYAKLDLKMQVNFYLQIADDFGRLKSTIYRTTKVNEEKLIVHLIKEHESLLNSTINPAEVLVVELDFIQPNSSYLSRGLGLGALICEDKKPKR